MNLFFSFFRTPATVKLEIETQFLVSLMENDLIHASDFRCLDLHSKKLVWRILLSQAKAKFGTSNDFLEEH